MATQFSGGLIAGSGITQVLGYDNEQTRNPFEIIVVLGLGDKAHDFCHNEVSSHEHINHKR